MMPYPTYKAPLVDPALVQLRNRLFSRGRTFSTPFGTGLAEWEIRSGAPSFPAVCSFELVLGTESWFVQLSDLTCVLRHEAFSADPEGFTLADLPAEVQKAVLFSLLSPSLQLLQEVMGTSAGIRNIEILSSPKMPSPESLNFKVRLSSGQSADHAFFAAFTPAGRSAAVNAAECLLHCPLKANPALAGAVASIPLEVALETGYLFLKAEELSTLNAEDLLLPEAWFLAEKRAKLRIYHGENAVLTGECSLQSGVPVLETPLSAEVENSMDNTTNDIEIRLSFELDRRLITVGELSSIAPGFTFPISGSEDSLVTVRANGKAIARGRLVDMNGTFGVQLTETL